MSITFALRGDSLDARYSLMGKTAGQYNSPTVVTDALAIGSKAIDMNTVVNSFLSYNGALNTPNTLTMSVLFRARMSFNNHPSSNQVLWSFCGPPKANFYGIDILNEKTGVIKGSFTDGIANYEQFTLQANFSSTSTDFNDFVLTWDGTTGPNTLKFYFNGDLQTAASHSTGFSGRSPWKIKSVNIGLDNAVLDPNASYYFLNEFVIWDEVIDPMALGLTGQSRTSYVSVDEYDGVYGPEPSGGSGGTVDLSDIKEQIRWILEKSNTITASPIDLSDNLNQRVKKVFKINPNRIAIQASMYPCVTCYIDEKSTIEQGIARNQLTSKRKADVMVSIAGLVWGTTCNTITSSDVDEDVEHLMENVENILRAYPDLNSAVTWQVPDRVTYNQYTISDVNYLAVGVLTLKGTKYY